MNIPPWISLITLNSSFIIYLFLYVPQIIHNHKTKNIAELSLWLHFLLYSSYTFDLYYGFSHHLPWQYKTVSLVGLSLMFIQHMQLTRFYIAQGCSWLVKGNIAFLIINLSFTFYFFAVAHCIYSAPVILIFGTLSRVCGLLYCVPQIIKNSKLKSAKAISLQFTLLNLLVSALDTVSAWCLNWGWPNQLGAPFNCMIMLVLLWQFKKYAEPDALMDNYKEVLISKA